MLFSCLPLSHEIRPHSPRLLHCSLLTATIVCSYPPMTRAFLLPQQRYFTQLCEGKHTIIRHGLVVPLSIVIAFLII
ncbi:hypothetical protein FGO68_gene3588 [Halteria grandinella]|uniref:Uncharacterized protein n=1 Tax=Halteria grandinella TaxID=5974 RepID=A0A8J8NHI8_HALGN|nr:hypothetical protein FGO68_gene3588 [Halteria grandinella]